MLVNDLPIRTPHDGKRHDGRFGSVSSGGNVQIEEIEDTRIGSLPPFLKEEDAIGVFGIDGEAEGLTVEVRERLGEVELSVGCRGKKLQVE